MPTETPETPTPTIIPVPTTGTEYNFEQYAGSSTHIYTIDILQNDGSIVRTYQEGISPSFIASFLMIYTLMIICSMFLYKLIRGRK